MYYTPAVPVCHALPVNSLHSYSGFIQASSIDPSCIPHNPQKENDLNSSVLLEKGAAALIASREKETAGLKRFNTGELLRVQVPV